MDYKVSRGARLTSRGITEARRVIRRHRLMELFLTKVLGLDWSEVDAEAELLEHAISPRLEQAIAKHLGEPLEDPHGHLIPSRDGKITKRDLRPLQEFPSGARAVIREVHDQHPARLRRWSDLGLLPGTLVTILNQNPLDGTFEIEAGGRTATLGLEGMSGLLAEPAPERREGGRVAAITAAATRVITAVRATATAQTADTATPISRVTSASRAARAAEQRKTF